MDALAEQYVKRGHVYGSNQGYVSMHFYCKDEELANELALMTEGRVEKHRSVFDVIITHRAVLGKCASRMLTELSLPDKHKRELVLIAKYANAKDRRERLGVCYQIRALQELRTEVPDADGLSV